MGGGRKINGGKQTEKLINVNGGAFQNYTDGNKIKKRREEIRIIIISNTLLTSLIKFEKFINGGQNKLRGERSAKITKNKRPPVSVLNLRVFRVWHLTFWGGGIGEKICCTAFTVKRNTGQWEKKILAQTNSSTHTPSKIKSGPPLSSLFSSGRLSNRASRKPRWRMRERQSFFRPSF